MLFTSQGRSVLGKTVPPVLCTYVLCTVPAVLCMASSGIQDLGHGFSQYEPLVW